MTSSRRKCVFNNQLENMYPFIKKTTSSSDVRCNTCNAEFNIANSGKNAIEKHLVTAKHVKRLQAMSTSRSVTEYLPSSVDLGIARYEGVWTYHVIKANYSFKSSECASKIFRTCFEIQKFHCAKTKCEAIATNVFAPFAVEEVKTDLSNVSYVSLSTDASNHGNVKLMPVGVRYFLPTVVKVKMLEFTSQKGEKSKMIADLIIDVATKNNLKDKVVGFCADNCATNFGSVQRGGENNVFFHLRQWIPSLTGVGCAAHIVHNSLKYACDFLPVDIEVIVVKIYSQFYKNTVRVEALKTLCEDFDDVEYSKLLGYKKTRFLALAPAIRKILKLFEPLKLYFLSLKRCPMILKSFFESPLSKIWFLFVKEQAEYFAETVLLVEGDNISATDVAHHLMVLKGNISIRKQENYIDPETEAEMNLLADYDLEIIKDVFIQFYDDASNYLDTWTDQFEDFNCFSWVSLKSFPSWSTVSTSMKIIAEKTSFDLQTNSSKVLIQYGFIKNYCSDEKIREWAKSKLKTELRWVEIFNHMSTHNVPFTEFALIIEYILCLAGTSCFLERIFADADKIWKQESTNLHISTLKSILLVKENMEFSCFEFNTFLKTQPLLLKRILSQDKYSFKQPTVSTTATSPGAMSVDSTL